MVWSSAQPHSVDDMVGKCFDAEEVEGGERGVEKDKESKKRGREHLVAIWARDTLGLTEGEYRECYSLLQSTP